MTDLCCVGGIMIHSLVPPKNWVGHGRYHYPPEFIEELTRQCRYELLIFERMKFYDLPGKDSIFVAWRKKEDDFVTLDAFKIIPLIDTGNMRHTGNYKKRKGTYE